MPPRLVRGHSSICPWSKSCSLVQQEDNIHDLSLSNIIQLAYIDTSNKANRPEGHNTTWRPAPCRSYLPSARSRGREGEQTYDLLSVCPLLLTASSSSCSLNSCLAVTKPKLLSMLVHFSPAVASILMSDRLITPRLRPRKHSHSLLFRNCLVLLPLLPVKRVCVWWQTNLSPFSIPLLRPLLLLRCGGLCIFITLLVASLCHLPHYMFL